MYRMQGRYGSRTNEEVSDERDTTSHAGEELSSVHVRIANVFLHDLWHSICLCSFWVDCLVVTCFILHVFVLGWSDRSLVQLVVQRFQQMHLQQQRVR